MVVCKFFRRGFCFRGENCRYKHEIDTLNTAGPATSGIATHLESLDRTDKANIPCRFFVRGNCNRGDRCLFRHSLSLDNAPVPQNSIPNERTRTHCRRFPPSGCADGDDCSSIHQENNLACLGAQLKNHDRDNFRRIIAGALVKFADAGGERNTLITQAKIYTKDSSLASTLQVTDGIPREHAISGMALRFTKLPVYTLPGMRLKGIDSRKIQISWRSSTRTVWLSFKLESQAVRVSKRFQDEVYDIKGSTVNATTGAEVLNPHKRPKLTVELTNVPNDADQSSINAAISEANDKPSYISLARLTYDATFEEVVSLLGFRLANFGDVVALDSLAAPLSKYAKVRATFKSSAEASLAAAALNTERQNFLGGGKLSVKIVHTLKAKILTATFDVLRNQLEFLAFRFFLWNKETALHFHRNTDFYQRLTAIRIEAASAKGVTEVNIALQKILGGTIARDADNSLLWLPLSDQNDWALQKVRKLQSDLQVKIVRDNRKKQLHILGPPEQIDAAVAALTRIINEERSELGKATISNIKTSSSSVQSSKNGNEDCVICWSGAEDPVTTSCGHIYCEECLENLCMEGDLGDAYTVICLGDSGQCQKPLELEELHSILPSVVFNAMLEHAFDSKVRKNPDSFHYCPTPDCGFYICTSCHDSHPNNSCAEFQYIKSGSQQAFEEYKKANNMKECPRCTLTMEKIDGCNHMSCPSCGAHVCWVCLDHFEAATECYDHLIEVHGHIGLVDHPAEEVMPDEDFAPDQIPDEELFLNFNLAGRHAAGEDLDILLAQWNLTDLLATVTFAALGMTEEDITLLRALAANQAALQDDGLVNDEEAGMDAYQPQ
ncbi:hypothetical protein BT63DRAFT_478795 [Microthyrium microscopicum]|uniref:RING-type E3 ubiquitin transferase n=1 Tax=Microthyrium microscopicum TaxID=703497 RepID=A0A6A6UGJ2_9PEZI|nr:hypothetical protein BT63DRAFT_478795 [Microthyrium microscopicum]